MSRKVLKDLGWMGGGGSQLARKGASQLEKKCWLDLVGGPGDRIGERVRVGVRIGIVQPKF